MSIFDISILLIIAGFAMAGIWFGFVHTLGSLLGTAVGAYVGTRWYDMLATWIQGITGWSDNVCTVIAFIILFFVVNRVVGFLFWLVERFFNPLTRLPFISSINRFLGLILGFFEGLLTLGLIFYVIDKFPVGDTFMAWVAASTVVPYTLGAADIFMPLIPEAFQHINTVLDTF